MNNQAGIAHSSSWIGFHLDTLVTIGQSRSHILLVQGEIISFWWYIVSSFKARSRVLFCSIHTVLFFCKDSNIKCEDSLLVCFLVLFWFFVWLCFVLFVFLTKPAKKNGKWSGSNSRRGAVSCAVQRKSFEKCEIVETFEKYIAPNFHHICQYSFPSEYNLKYPFPKLKLF